MHRIARGQEPDSGNSGGADLSAVRELLAQRARITEWLGRLDEASISNPRAAERVREDYRQRLGSLMAELADHREALGEQRRRLARSLAEAESAEQAARDELDEAELRYRIGEIEGSAWEEKRSSLEAAAAAATAAVAEARDEASRLDDVLESIEGGLDTVPSPGDESVPAEAVLGARDGSEAGATQEDKGHPEPETRSGFLEELDRAIEGSAETRPRAGAKCPECGYTNDFDAWYCGVCGVDLA